MPGFSFGPAAGTAAPMAVNRPYVYAVALAAAMSGFLFGFDIAVLEQVETVNWLKGDALYLYCALRQLFGYRGITVDVAPRGPEPHLMLVIANGKNFGGAFRMAPGASITDGLLDAVAIGAASPMRRVALFGAATKGTHVGKPEVRTTQASSASSRSTAARR